MSLLESWDNWSRRGLIRALVFSQNFLYNCRKRSLRMPILGNAARFPAADRSLRNFAATSELVLAFPKGLPNRLNSYRINHAELNTRRIVRRQAQCTLYAGIM